MVRLAPKIPSLRLSDRRLLRNLFQKTAITTNDLMRIYTFMLKLVIDLKPIRFVIHLPLNSLPNLLRRDIRMQKCFIRMKSEYHSFKHLTTKTTCWLLQFAWLIGNIFIYYSLCKHPFSSDMTVMAQCYSNRALAGHCYYSFSWQWVSVRARFVDVKHLKSTDAQILQYLRSVTGNWRSAIDGRF